MHPIFPLVALLLNAIHGACFTIEILPQVEMATEGFSGGVAHYWYVHGPTDISISRESSNTQVSVTQMSKERPQQWSKSIPISNGGPWGNDYEIHVDPHVTTTIRVGDCNGRLKLFAGPLTRVEIQSTEIQCLMLVYALDTDPGPAFSELPGPVVVLKKNRKSQRVKWTDEHEVELTHTPKYRIYESIFFDVYELHIEAELGNYKVLSAPCVSSGNHTVSHDDGTEQLLQTCSKTVIHAMNEESPIGVELVVSQDHATNNDPQARPWFELTSLEPSKPAPVNLLVSNPLDGAVTTITDDTIMIGRPIKLSARPQRLSVDVQGDIWLLGSNIASQLQTSNSTNHTLRFSFQMSGSDVRDKAQLYLNGPLDLDHVELVLKQNIRHLEVSLGDWTAMPSRSHIHLGSDTALESINITSRKVDSNILPLMDPSTGSCDQYFRMPLKSSLILDMTSVGQLGLAQPLRQLGVDLGLASLRDWTHCMESNTMVSEVDVTIVDDYSRPIGSVFVTDTTARTLNLQPTESCTDDTIVADCGEGGILYGPTETMQMRHAGHLPPAANCSTAYIFTGYNESQVAWLLYNGTQLLFRLAATDLDPFGSPSGLLQGAGPLMLDAGFCLNNTSPNQHEPDDADNIQASGDKGPSSLAAIVGSICGAAFVCAVVAAVLLRRRVSRDLKQDRDVRPSIDLLNTTVAMSKVNMASGNNPLFVGTDQARDTAGLRQSDILDSMDLQHGKAESNPLFQTGTDCIPARQEQANAEPTYDTSAHPWTNDVPPDDDLSYAALTLHSGDPRQAEELYGGVGDAIYQNAPAHGF